MSLVTINERNKLDSRTCRSCLNCIDWARHGCKIHGKSPQDIWNDERPCPDRIPTEGEVPVYKLKNYVAK